LEREGVSNFSASPYLIVDILILNTSDGSTVLNEIQGDVCVSFWFGRCNRGANFGGKAAKGKSKSVKRQGCQRFQLGKLGLL
jgi:hypothetical protein